MFKKIIVLCSSMMVLWGSQMPVSASSAYSIKQLTKNTGDAAFTENANVDLDHDGVKEQITMTGDYNKTKAYYSAFHLIINNHDHTLKKSALQRGTFAVGLIKVYVIQMKNQTYLYVRSGSYVDDAYFRGYIYTYNSKSDALKCVCQPETDLYNKASYIIGGDIANVKANSFDFTAYISPTEIGTIKVTYSFVLKNNKLVRQNNYCKVKGRSRYKVYQPLTFYKAVNRKAVAFKAKKNAQVKLVQGYVKKGSVYLQFKMGRKTGWRKCSYQSFNKIYKNSNNYWFYNTGSYFGG